ncbi:hypothetical protein CFE70_010055 [Pyrenophora teres f. teres 0-1]
MAHEQKNRDATQEEPQTPSAQLAATPKETSGSQSDQASSNSGDIICTPPATDSASTTSMATPSNSEEISQPILSSARPADDTYVTVIAANNNAIPVLENGNEPNISKREYIYFLPYPLPQTPKSHTQSIYHRRTHLTFPPANSSPHPRSY